MAAATAIHVAVYNYCRIHSTIRCTPAMAAGVVDRLWGMGDLFDAVMSHGAEKAERKRRDWRDRSVDQATKGETKSLSLVPIQAHPYFAAQPHQLICPGGISNTMRSSVFSPVAFDSSSHIDFAE